MLSVLSFSAFALQCVTYVRQQNEWDDFPQTPPDHEAYRWWNTARDSGYSTNSTPIIGAVLVWKKWEQNSAGHVAIVASIVSDEKITVMHANWPLGSLGHEDAVTKANAEGAWTSVKVGSENAPHDVYGFIYPKGNPQPTEIPVTCQGDTPAGLRKDNSVKMQPSGAHWKTLLRK